VGPVTLRFYGPIVVAGIAAGWWICRRYAHAVGITVDDVDAIALWAIIAGIVGTRALHVIDKWPEIYASDPLLAPQIWRGGGAIWGGIIGGVAGGAIAAWRHGIYIPAVADVGALGLILGQAIGRLANVVNGEHTRVESDLPWAFLYTNPATLAARDGLGATFPAHPAHLYEMLADFLILAVLIYAISRWGGSGRVFALYAFAYSLFRFLITFLRQDELYGPFSQAQWIAVVIGMVAALALFLFWTGRLPTRNAHWRRARGQIPSPAPDSSD
jgi:phosphatidylglycerol:prolipoprotein diacylglycerol transferase